MKFKSKLLILLCVGLGYFIYNFNAKMANTAQRAVENLMPQAEQQIDTLNQALANAKIPRANQLKKYIGYMVKRFPEHNAIAKVLFQETKANSPAILNFRQRIVAVKNTTEAGSANEGTAKEINSIIIGTKPEVFDRSFVDLINTASDLMGNKLPRVYLSKSEQASKELYKDGLGAHLVGNENYGQWQGKGNNKTWIWQGALAGTALYSAYKFSQWSSRRGWSYYNDMGRNLYGTSSAKSFAGSFRQKSNRMFKPSQYARSVQSNKCKGLTKQMSSMCSSNEKYYGARYQGSHRNSTSARSRGNYGGK